MTILGIIENMDTNGVFKVLVPYGIGELYKFDVWEGITEDLLAFIIAQIFIVVYFI